jgi:SAM-dependent methyltransferase
MRADIVNLRQFYSSSLGRRVKARLCRITLNHWPSHKGDVILGIGYTLPMLRVIERTSNGLVVALMPAVQGAIYWPVHSENRTILGDEMRPPFAPNSVSRIVMLHTLEHADAPEELLRVLWQLLEPGGQLLLMVPNRHGLWSRVGKTPFATGKAYTLTELKKLLGAADYTLREVSTSLYLPPSAHPLWFKLAGFCELVGHMLFPRHGGIHVIEAEKQIYAGLGERATLRKEAAAWAGTSAAPALSTSQSSRKIG